jgi:WD40 repeat protein
MEFMPDNNQFIMSTTRGVQIRNTLTGEIANTPNFYAANIEFSPDSTKLIITNGWDKVIQTRNITDYSIINEYILPEGTDTASYDFEFSYLGLKEIVVDPIRPLIYAVRERSGQTKNGQPVLIRKIIIYNYETMEEVGKLTSPAEDTLWYKDIAISKDGKYLAAITESKSYIKVWDLNTRQKIRDFKVCDKISTYSGSPDQITFSQINTDNIYFSGTFPQTKDYYYDGIMIYNIAQNKITDSTFAVGDKSVFGGRFCLFDNETRIIITRMNKIIVMNNISKDWEQQINKDTISGGQIFWGFQRYSNTIKIILGFGNSSFSCIKNNLGTSVPIPQTEGTVFPNPTTGEVNIETEDTLIKGIKIYDANGAEVTSPSLRDTPPYQGGEKVQFNVSNLPSGEYFIVLEGKVKQTYKLIINK